MGKKKGKLGYNDFLDGEKLRDNTEIRTTLQGVPAKDISSPAERQPQNKDHKRGKGGAAKRKLLTHFLCLPLVTETSRPQLQQGLETFKEDLIKDGPVPTTAVRPVGTMHLTLGVMSLDTTELEEASHYLQDLDLHNLLRDITHRRIAEKAAEDGEIAENLNAAAMPDTDALTVTLESLLPMQKPHQTSILYAEPRDPSQRLEAFALALREQFAEKGFMVQDTRPLRLHATVMNTIYAKPKRGGRGGGHKSDKIKQGLKHVEHKVSPHRHHHHHHHHGEARDEGGRNGNGEDAASTAAEGAVAAGEGHGPDGKSWMRFDARNLIDKYKGFVWANSVRVDRVYICKMGAKKVWSGGSEGEGEVLDEEYEVVAAKEILS
ncbi:akap7 2 5 rna ligase-like domain [Pyrenophora seminiperda CCB06]|uniref:Akap7 2 5 rna ligase-like domain n=1 Tax=Pyrenophora seminiperda CCB06 TaxID=1302712 RepID=A0A3M7MA75_9PLEO|nr:akap7 2 5 rna ligase-like domain [Pyrenophora seminiperda CCB06]